MTYQHTIYVITNCRDAAAKRQSQILYIVSKKTPGLLQNAK